MASPARLAPIPTRRSSRPLMLLSPPSRLPRARPPRARPARRPGPSPTRQLRLASPRRRLRANLRPVALSALRRCCVAVHEPDHHSVRPLCAYRRIVYRLRIRHVPLFAFVALLCTGRHREVYQTKASCKCAYCVMFSFDVYI